MRTGEEDNVEAERELAHETWSEYFDAISKELLNAALASARSGEDGQCRRWLAQRQCFKSVWDKAERRKRLELRGTAQRSPTRGSPQI
jgi:hypothetical protein